MHTPQKPRCHWIPARHILALELSAAHSVVVVIVVGSQRITQFVFVHNPARTGTLDRLIYADGAPFGSGRYHTSGSHTHSYHLPSPDRAANEAAQAHLGLLSSGLFQGVSICYVSMPVPPPDRAPRTRSPSGLIPEVGRPAATLACAAITVAWGTGGSWLFPHEADWPTAPPSLVESGGAPNCVVGFRSRKGNGRNGQNRVQFSPFPEDVETPCALDCLQRMADVLVDLWRAGGAHLCLVAPTQCPTCTRSPADLVLAPERHPQHLLSATIGVVLDRSTNFVFTDDLHRLTSRDRLIAFGDPPITLIGTIEAEGGSRVYPVPFPGCADLTWAHPHLGALCERLHQHPNPLGHHRLRPSSCQGLVNLNARDCRLAHELGILGSAVRRICRGTN